jgi:hypothetical protein
MINNLPKRDVLSRYLLRWYDQQELDKITNRHITWTCIASRVDLPDGDYSLVPETEEGGAEASLQYVKVPDDTEGAQANLADEGKLLCI